MLRLFTTIAVGALLLLLPGCDKKDDPSVAPGASAQAPGAPGSGDKREHEHEWDGGPHGDHPH
jgi:hypothetical protein